MFSNVIQHLSEFSRQHPNFLNRLQPVLCHEDSKHYPLSQEWRKLPFQEGFSDNFLGIFQPNEQYLSQTALDPFFELYLQPQGLFYTTLRWVNGNLPLSPACYNHSNPLLFGSNLPSLPFPLRPAPHCPIELRQLPQ